MPIFVEETLTPPPSATVTLAPPTPDVTPSPTLEPRPLITAQPGTHPQLVWFYKAPSDGDFAAIAAHFGMAILSYGNEDDREAFRSEGMLGPFLQYLRFDVIQDPGSCTRKPWKNQVAYQPGDFCRISQEHPDWFLLDSAGKRIIDPYGGETFVMMDPGHPGWRAFWLERARLVQEQGGWDGVFLDNVEVTFAFREQRDEMPQVYPDEASYQQAVQGFLKLIYQDYFQPNQKLLYANIVARKDDVDFTKYLEYLDGAMLEGWAIDWPDGYRSASTWEKHLRLAEDTQALGKTILLVSQGLPEQSDLQSFAFASYLLVMDGRAYFRFANSDRYREAWLYPNYGLDLGQPLGNRYPTENGWRRDFKNGWVEVDPTQHTAKIELSGLSPEAVATLMPAAAP